ncbi:hypothetical protein BKA93DRAFT_550543 [Sparassis latifolia]
MQLEIMHAQSSPPSTAPIPKTSIPPPRRQIQMDYIDTVPPRRTRAPSASLPPAHHSIRQSRSTASRTRYGVLASFSPRLTDVSLKLVGRSLFQLNSERETFCDETHLPIFVCGAAL